MISRLLMALRFTSVVFIGLVSYLATGMHAQTTSSSKAGSFQNPVLWEDLADIDIIRVGDAYYYSASNMAYSPGAPILKSYDLVHWQYVGHSLPKLDFGPAYDLTGGNAYNKGTWASSMQYRKSDKTLNQHKLHLHCTCS